MNQLTYNDNQFDLFGERVTSGRCSITAEKGGLKVATPYNSNFVEEFKSVVPSGARSYDPPTKCWFVDAAWGERLTDLILRHYGEIVSVPDGDVCSQVLTETFRLEYIGRCKPKSIDFIQLENVATGFANDAWCLLFPEQVLKTWFEINDEIEPDEPVSPNETPRAKTYYQILGVKKTATFPEIKTAFRRAAVHCHPDRCKEEDAAERFMALRKAFDVVFDPPRRNRYDFALSLEQKERKNLKAATRRQIKNEQANRARIEQWGYAAPLRCGNVRAQGAWAAGKFRVSLIEAWDDITNERGEVMTSYWNKYSQKFEILWIDPNFTNYTIGLKTK